MYEFLSAGIIAETLSIPRPTLVKILQNLSKAGIIETKEGKHGGIRMAKTPDQLTVLDVFLAMEQEKSLFQTNIEIKAMGDRPDSAKDSITGVLQNAETEMKKILGQKRIIDILNEMK